MNTVARRLSNAWSRKQMSGEKVVLITPVAVISGIPPVSVHQLSNS